MEKERIHFKMDIDAEVRALLKDISAMDKEAQGRLKDDVKIISGWVATEIKQAATKAPMPAQAARVANTVRAVKDRVPYVVVGGTAQKFSGGGRSGVVLFGSEFGASPTSSNGAFPNGGRRFPYRSGQGGTQGYWIFPTLKRLQPQITKAWHNRVDHVLSNWKKGAI